MERPTDVQLLEKSLRKMNGSTDFKYQHENGTEVYRTFELPIGDQNVIVAVKKEGITVDFLTTLRNCVADQNPAQFVGRSLLIIYETELDSISKGCKNLSSTHGPLNFHAILKSLTDALDEPQAMSHEWEKVALRMLLAEATDRIATGSFSLLDFAPVVVCMQNQKISRDQFRGLHLFYDPNIDEASNKAERLSENFRLYDLVERAIASDSPETRLSKVFTEKGTEELLKSEETWATRNYADVIALQQEAIKELDVEYLPGSEKSYCDGMICWDRPKSGTAAGQRHRHIIVWNQDHLSQIMLKLRFAGRPQKSSTVVQYKSDNLDVHVDSIISKVLTLALTISEQGPCFAEVKHQRMVFHIAIYPGSSKGLENLKIGYEVVCRQRRLDIALDNKIQLVNYGSDGDIIEERELHLTPNVIIPLGKPGVVTLNTASDESGEPIDAILERSETQLSLRFKPEISPITPISGASIAQQKRQRKSDCVLNMDNGSMKVQIGSEEYGLSHENRNLYPLEKIMLSSGGIAWRLTHEDVTAIELRIPAPIEFAYRKVLSIFACRQTIPSLTYFDEEVCKAVELLCAEIQKFYNALPDYSQISTEAESVIQIGSVIDHENNRILLSPFSPLNLAFESALTRRIGGDQTSVEILKLLNQAALLPYLQWPTWGSSKTFAARPIPEAPQWLEYRPKTESHTFGSRVSQTVASKLDQFTRHFKFLFDSSIGAPLVVYLINLGDCTEVVKGIAQYYNSQIESSHDKLGRASDFWIDDLIPIHVHIFGRTDSVTQFDRMTHSAWNVEAFELFGTGSGERDHGDLIEALLRKVHFFYRREKEFDEISQDGIQAHIAFMQTGGGVSEYFAGAQFSYNQKEMSFTGISLGGLNSDLPSHMYGNLYRSGFGTKGLHAEYRNELIDIADALNTITRFVGRTDPYSPKESLFQVFDKETHGLLTNAFESSQWVCFIDPQFDLDFFQGRSDVIVLHYSDRYNNASGYDAITVTDKITQYREMLKDAILSETEVQHHFSDLRALDGMVQLFNAINGEWLLEMVNTSLTSRKEKIGVISALKAILAFLQTDTDYLWVPISIEEIVRVSGAVGLGQKDGPFSARNMGFAGSFSDDVLLIGVRPSDSAERVSMVYYPVEVKYGTFSSSVVDKAFQQGAAVTTYFRNSSNDSSFSGVMFRNFFAKLFINGAEKLHTFGFWSDEKWKKVCDELRVPLLNDHIDILEASTAGRGNFGIVGFNRQCIARTARIEERLFEAQNCNFARMEFTMQDCIAYCEKSLPEIRATLENDTHFFRVAAIKSSIDSAPGVGVVGSGNHSEIESLESTNSDDTKTTFLSDHQEPDSIEATALPSFSTLSNDDRRNIYIRIYQKLQALKVDLTPVRPEDIEFREGPTVYMVAIPLAASAKIRDLERAQVDLNLVLQLPGESSVRVVPDRGIAWLEVPKSDEKRVAVTTEHIWSKFSADPEQFAIPFAVDITGATVCIDFASANSPHLLIAGTTGSGKSVALETIIRGAAHLYDSHHLNIFLVDPKGNELVDFEDLPQVVSPNGRTAHDAIDKLRACVDEMEARYELFREAKQIHGKSAKKLSEYNRMVETPIPRWLVILDEYSDLVESSKENKNEIESLLKRLSQKARAAGIHLIIATQKPLAEIVNSVVKSNLPAAIALKVKSNSDSRVIIDEGGAELLSGRGDALFRTGTGRIVRVQIAMHDN